MNWVGHFNFATIYTGNFHRKGYLMLHHLAGATIQVANFRLHRPVSNWGLGMEDFRTVQKPALKS